MEAIVGLRDWDCRLGPLCVNLPAPLRPFCLAPQTVMYKGTRGGLVDKLKHLAAAGTASKQGSPAHSPAGSRVGSRAPSRGNSEKSLGVHSHAGSHMSMGQRIAQARRDEYDVDSDDEDLDGFIYEDESTSEDEREDYVNAFSRKKKLPKANDYSEYEGAGVRALTAGRKVREAGRGERGRLLCGTVGGGAGREGGRRRLTPWWLMGCGMGWQVQAWCILWHRIKPFFACVCVLLQLRSKRPRAPP